jgi:hypothetical protein
MFTAKILEPCLLIRGDKIDKKWRRYDKINFWYIYHSFDGPWSSSFRITTLETSQIQWNVLRLRSSNPSQCNFECKQSFHKPTTFITLVFMLYTHTHFVPHEAIFSVLFSAFTFGSNASLQPYKFYSFRTLMIFNYWTWKISLILKI